MMSGTGKFDIRVLRELAQMNHSSNGDKVSILSIDHNHIIEESKDDNVLDDD